MDCPTCIDLNRSPVGEKAEEKHPCPFDEDVNNDPTPTCYCCENCIFECAQDI